MNKTFEDKMYLSSRHTENLLKYTNSFQKTMQQSPNARKHKDEEYDKVHMHEEATFSHGETNDPITVAHNVNDLKTFDLNSADDVRQAFKAAFKDKNRVQGEDGEYCSLVPKITVQSKNRNEHHYNETDIKRETENKVLRPEVKVKDSIQKHNEIISADVTRREINHCDEDKLNLCTANVKANITGNVNKTNKNQTNEINQETKQPKIRKGRPPKAGPSRKYMKTQQKSDVFFRGKLSNLILMKRKPDIESSSEDDSILTF